MGLSAGEAPAGVGGWGRGGRPRRRPVAARGRSRARSRAYDESGRGGLARIVRRTSAAFHPRGWPPHEASPFVRSTRFSPLSGRVRLDPASRTEFRAHSFPRRTPSRCLGLKEPSPCGSVPACHDDPNHPPHAPPPTIWPQPLYDPAWKKPGSSCSLCSALWTNSTSANISPASSVSYSNSTPTSRRPSASSTNLHEDSTGLP